MDSQKTKIQSPAKKVIPRRISQTTTSQNIENQLRPTLRRCGQYQRSLLDTKVAGRDSQAPYLPEPIFCSFPSNFPTISSIGWQASIFHQELEGAHSGPLGVVHHPGVHIFITEEVQSLFKKGVIVQVKDQSLDSKRFYSTLSTVPKKGGKRRPIINLKAQIHPTFKMEGIQSLRELILPGDFMIKLDLKDAYFQFQYTTLSKGF